MNFRDPEADPKVIRKHRICCKIRGKNTAFLKFQQIENNCNCKKTKSKNIEKM